MAHDFGAYHDLTDDTASPAKKQRVQFDDALPAALGALLSCAST
jgi:hypothetical protein